jgi:predicted transcriptional regulator
MAVKKAKVTQVKPVEAKVVSVEAKPVETVFGEVEEKAVAVQTPNDIEKPDSDLDARQKAEFSRLLRTGLNLPERAKRLIKLTTFTDSKRAPVALRALQEINSITGITADAPDEGAALFVLPDGGEIAVAIKVPKK